MDKSSVDCVATIQTRGQEQYMLLISLQEALTSQVKEISKPIPRNKVYPSNEPPQKSLALLIFHAFIGCDTVSSFSINDKKTAWKTWEAHQGLVSDDPVKALEG